MDRKYPDGMINSAVCKAKSIPRAVAIRKVVEENSSKKRPVFVISWDPRLPSLSTMTQKHWRSMINQDQLMKEVFPERPLIAFKRQRNLEDSLIREKIQSINLRKSNRKLRGMSKCGKGCHACVYVDD